MTTTAAVTEAEGAPFKIQELDLDELRSDEVLVEVAASGICHTDLICRDQWYPVPLPAVLGHEGAGTVVDVGSAVRAVAKGDRVGMSFASCGHCRSCLRGLPSYCYDFFARNFGSSRADGTTSLSRNGNPIHSHYFGQSSFAAHSVASERNIVKLDDSVPFEIAAPLGCGVQTGAGAVLNVFKAPVGSTMAIFGTGTVGISAIMAAVVAGCQTIIGIDLKEARLNLAMELGATHVINGATSNPLDSIQQITKGGVDFALDTTGAPPAFRMTVESTVPTGVAGLVGAPKFGTEVSLDMNGILTMGRTVRGIVEGDSIPHIFLPVLMDLWKKGRFPVDRLIKNYDFDAINQGAADSEAGLTVKPVLLMK